MCISLPLAQIYCSSSSFFLDSPSVRGISVESQEFFAGIRVNNIYLTFIFVISLSSNFFVGLQTCTGLDVSYSVLSFLSCEVV